MDIGYTVVCALALLVYLTIMWIDLNIRIARVSKLLEIAIKENNNGQKI